MQGEVRKALHFKTGEIRAIKKISKSEIGKENWSLVLREIEILRSLDHPNIVKILEFFESVTHFLIVMEYCPGKAIDKRKLSERNLSEMMTQILEALFYLHKKKITHLDLNPRNIICKKNKIKIIGFGLSRKLNSKIRDYEPWENCLFLSPEVLSGKFSLKSDVWAAGVVLFKLVTGKLPFSGDSPEEMLKAISNTNWLKILKKKASPELTEFLSAMLQISEKQRADCAQLLQHPWLLQVPKFQSNQRNIELIDNIKSPQFSDKLQRGLFYFFVHNLVSGEEHEQFSETFKLLDRNRDGELSKDDFLLGMKTFGKHLSQQKIMGKFRLLDADKTGSLSYMDFVAGAFSKQTFLQGSRLKRLFRSIDHGKSGKVSVSELSALFRNFEFISQQEIAKAFKSVDIHTSGKIGFCQFQKFMGKMATKKF